MERIALVEWLDKSRNKCPKNIYLYWVGIVTKGIFEINNVFGVVQSKKFFQPIIYRLFSWPNPLVFYLKR